VIISGGPVGLCLALCLRATRFRDGRRREADIVRDLRASTFHPPTLDLLEPLGITATLIARGLPCPTCNPAASVR
jgi:3-(3-hydroxy-phenyl)propionate hydroxylase